MVFKQTALVVFCCVFASLFDSPMAEPRPYTIDDKLALEATGRGVASQDRLIWEQAPPYDQIGYYGHDHTGAWRGTGFQLVSLKLDDVEGGPSALFDSEPGVSYWIDAVSPTGQYIIYRGAKEGSVFLGSYDTFNDHHHTIDLAPQIDWIRGHEVVWISDDEFVFSALNIGEQPLLSARPYSTRRLLEESQRTWAGGLAVSAVGTLAPDEGSSSQWIKGALYRVSALTGAVDRLAEGSYQSIKISADRRYLAALRQAKLPDLNVAHQSTDWVDSHSLLHIFDLSCECPPKIYAKEKNILVETLAWAPDRNRLAFFAWKLSEENVQSGIFHALEADTGSLVAYPHAFLDLASERERGLVQKPERAVWIDDRLALFARRHDSNEPRFTYRGPNFPKRSSKESDPHWYLLDHDGNIEELTTSLQSVSAIPIYADRASITVLADGNVWRVGPDYAAENLTAHIDTMLDHTNQSKFSSRHRPFKSQVVMNGGEIDNPIVVLMDLEAGHVALIVPPVSDVQLIGVSVNHEAALYRFDHAGGADLILKYSDGSQVTLDVLNEHLSEVSQSSWTTIKYPASSDTGTRELVSCVLFPPDYEPGRRYPVIVDVYPSRSASHCNSARGKQRNAIGRRQGVSADHLLAARGYIVFKPSLPSDLARTPSGPIQGMPELVERGLDALIDLGYADPDRIGLIGFSQGAFSALHIATRSDRFKAVVALNGWSDLYSHYFDSSYLQMYYIDARGFAGSAKRYDTTIGSDLGIGKRVFADPEAYLRNSPMLNSGDVDAPILLIHSDRDSFAMSQFEMMYVALKLQDKEARLLRYWGEGHGPSSPENMRHMWTEIFEWFDGL